MSGGQTLNDRLTAARHALAGQGLARIVCKATTEEVIGPKKKHLDYLIHCTNEPNVSIPSLANLLIERTQNTSWVVVFKGLITVHHLMCYGNERFVQYLASSNCTFQLGSFLDKVGVQSYDMSTFIRRYAKYLNEKAVSYRVVAFDFCKCKRGREDGVLRQMNTEQLLKTLSALMAQLDSLLEFDCSTNDLCNGVVNSCFMLLFRDLVRLFACYNDGIINLLGKYFEMNKKHARDALDIYKKFLIRMDRVAEFLKVAENIGVDKGDIPDLTKAPSSLLEALEQHLATLEGRKGSLSTASAAARDSLQSAVTALSTTSVAFCSAGDSSPTQDGGVNGVGSGAGDESSMLRKAVEEEAQVMNQLKFDNDSPLLWEQPAWNDSERRLKEMTGDPLSPPAGSAKTNPFLSSPAADPVVTNQRILDLFNTPAADILPPATNGSPADDLLGLTSNNPFADSLFGGGPPAAAPRAVTPKAATPQQPSPAEHDAFGVFTNGFGSSGNAFASDASFAAAFGDSPTASAFDAFGDALQPQQPSQLPTKQPEKTSSSILKGDLDSTLASLASNLAMDGPKGALKKTSGHQWGSPKAAPVKPGGWTAPAAVVPVPGANPGWQASPQHGFQQPQMGGQALPPAGGQWGGGGMMGGAYPPQAGGGVFQQQPQQPYMGGVRPGMGVMPPMSGMPPQQPMYGGTFQQQMPIMPQAGMQQQANDPFGAL